MPKDEQAKPYKRISLPKPKTERKFVPCARNSVLDDLLPAIAPHIRKHRHGTKAYKEATQLIRGLKTATLDKYDFADWSHICRAMTGNKYWSDEPIKRMEILKFRSTKFTKDQLIELFTRLEKIFTNGYIPVDKKHLPKDLKLLLYPINGGFSWMVYAWLRDIPLIKREIIEPPNDYEKKLLQQFLDRFIIEKEEIPKILKTIRIMRVYHKNHLQKKFKFSNSSFATYKENFPYFYTAYLDYIGEEFYGELVAWRISVGSKFWNNFLQYIESEMPNDGIIVAKDDLPEWVDN